MKNSFGCIFILLVLLTTGGAWIVSWLTGISVAVTHIIFGCIFLGLPALINQIRIVLDIRRMKRKYNTYRELAFIAAYYNGTVKDMFTSGNRLYYKGTEVTEQERAKIMRWIADLNETDYNIYMRKFSNDFENS